MVESFDPDRVEVIPLVVLSKTFPARPSSIPDIRDFVHGCLAQSPLSGEDSRSVEVTVQQALLDAAGPTGTIQVAFRIFPDHVEVDVLRSHPRLSEVTQFESLSAFLEDTDAGASPPTYEAEHVGARLPPVYQGADDGAAAAVSGAPHPRAAYPGGAAEPWADGADTAEPAAEPATQTSFANWMSGELRRQGMTMEVAARQLGVSVKTVSRWVGGATEPRLRDLRRIREVFGDLPFP